MMAKRDHKAEYRRRKELKIQRWQRDFMTEREVYLRNRAIIDPGQSFAAVCAGIFRKFLHG